MFHPIFRKHRHHAEPGRRVPLEAYWTRRRSLIVAVFSLAVMATSLGFYFLVYLPVQANDHLRLLREDSARRERIEAARLEAEDERQIRWERAQDLIYEKNASERKLQGVELDRCIVMAEDAYVMLWDRECSARGLTEDCLLPDAAAATLNAHLKDLKDECFKRFPQSPPGTTDSADET